MMLFAQSALWQRLIRFLLIRELWPLRSCDLCTVLPLLGWPLRPPVITPGSWVLLYDPQFGRQQLVQLVWPAQAAPRRGRISVLSPLGLQLLQAGCGDTVCVRLLGQVCCYQICDLLSQPRPRHVPGRRH